jgi:hypothetical protein
MGGDQSFRMRRCVDRVDLVPLSVVLVVLLVVSVVVWPDELLMPVFKFVFVLVVFSDADVSVVAAVLRSVVGGRGGVVVVVVVDEVTLLVGVVPFNSSVVPVVLVTLVVSVPYVLLLVLLVFVALGVVVVVVVVVDDDERQPNSANDIATTTQIIQIVARWFLIFLLLFCWRCAPRSACYAKSALMRARGPARSGAAAAGRIAGAGGGVGRGRRVRDWRAAAGLRGACSGGRRLHSVGRADRALDRFAMAGECSGEEGDENGFLHSK